MNINILQGNCAETLKTLEAGSVQTCVTSPPYFGLRDYGTAEWEGGDPECDHRETDRRNGRPNGKFHGGNDEAITHPYRGRCPKCGAVRIDQQIGLEDTPEAYVEKLVAVFREVRRVLADEGTLWLNLGDSYFSDTKGTGGPTPKQASNAGSFYASRKFERTNGIKPKDLIGIPWMVAFALRADGWYLRSDIIWHKPNPMPESVTDRPTKSHEQIFLLAKSAHYYYDAEAIKEPSNWAGDPRAGYGRLHYRGKREGQSGTGQENFVSITDTRNKRDVWTVNTKPYKEAHFATFPPDLIEPCILAGSRPGDTVLDPFNGSGTTGAVAIKHHRNYIGCELNPEYVELTNERLAAVQPVLLEAQS